MNLRIIGINAADSRTIKVKFSNNLDPNISAQNVKVLGKQDSTPDALVRSAIVSGDILIITVLPMTPFVKYDVVFSSNQSTFKSADGRDFLVQDGVENVREVIGAEDPSNIFRDNLVSSLIGQPYVPERGSLIRTMFNEISNGFLRIQRDIRQSKNDNYLSFYVTNERKRRGYGPYDRLSEEGAIRVDRVGLTPSNQTLSGSISYNSFPSDVITLQQRSVSDERLEAGSGPQTFDRFTLTVNRYPVTKVNRVRILYQNGDVFEYNIRAFGYQINEPKYDTSFASTLLTIDDNQIKLNDEVLQEPGFSVPQNGDFVAIDYDFKSTGRIIDGDSVSVTQMHAAVRQPTPALSREFSLGNAPIVNESNNIPSIGGIAFLDPNSDEPFKTTHPAFVKEIPFRVDALPKNLGEYSVDYQNGRVFVYGAETDDGTGVFPPAATYNYRTTFRRDLDYTYRAETSELVASPLRKLVGQSAKISFLFEETLVEGIDYKTGVHQEVLDERVNNRILSANSIRVVNSPITNVFRIFNESTGEIYRLNRFFNDKVVFSYNNPPNIEEKTLERSVFRLTTGEQLIVNSEFTNILGTRVFKIPLLNENIMSATEDVIGSSYNSSVSFSRNDIFENELFYEGQILDDVTNYSKLGVGDYQIDYRNGIVFVGVTNAQDFGIGTVSYRTPVIAPKNPHVISVSEIYYSLSPALGVSKRLNYSGFEDSAIYPSVFDVSDERFLNSDVSMPYQVANGSITVQDNIRAVRNVFDNADLLSSSSPVNFGPSASFNANTIILDSDGVETSQNTTVGAGLVINIDTNSTGISLNSVKSVVRISDNQELLDGYESISGNDITLSGGSGAVAGDAVNVIYNVVLNNAATPIVDYDRGEHFIDYTYLADEIIVSYEYGDNVLDFRESTTVEVGQEYFASYRVGALRDSLLENFGSLIEIPELNSFSVDLERERYRDAIIGSLQSFTRGPTNPSMKDMIAEVTKIQPEIIEAAFQYWALGITPLYKNQFKLNCPLEETSSETVERTMVPAQFDMGYLPTKEGDFISFPVSSNLRLEEGTMEMTVTPEWDGVDNDATLTFKNLKKDGYALNSTQIFIGSSSYNPEIDLDGVFKVSRFDELSPVGLPSSIFTSTGLFIYYDDQEKHWKVLVKEKVGTVDGYNFTGEIISSGEVYDVKKIPGVSDFDDYIRSDQNKIEFSFNINSTDDSSPDGYSSTDGYVSGYSFDGLTFMADSLHYFFDFAENQSKNRFSLYKDGRGYLNFSVWDKGGGYALDPDRRSRYVVSADISDWKTGEEHNIGISWRLNSKDRRDEMHIYVDGLEVPNIIRYGGVPAASSTDRFRTVQPEVVAGVVPKTAVAGTCVTVQGSDEIIGNGVDFGFLGIVPGDTIEIQETGFSSYIINAVSGSTLTLSSPMPASLADAAFTVNPYSVVVSSEIDIYKNIAVYELNGGVETEIPGRRATIPGYEFSKNAFNQNVLRILGGVDAGSQILIRTLGLNHRRCREKVYLWSDQAVLRTQLPAPINLDEVMIRAVPVPYSVLGPSNSAIVLGTFQRSFTPTELSNTTEGRQLEVRIAGGNVDFSTPTTVTINGTSDGGAVEVLNFSSAEKQITANKWQTITSIDVVTTPFTTSRTSAGIEVKEAYSVTTPNNNSIYPVIRFGYQTQAGLTLEGDGSDIVSDSDGFFAASVVGNPLVIESPPSVAGTYTIQEKIDNQTVRLGSAIGAAFSSGQYKTFNISIGRSGFQNGFFFLEQAGSVNVPYELPQGYYEFDFSTYLSVPFDPVGGLEAHLGSDFMGKNQANAKIDEFRILSRQLTDTRVGETIGLNDESITTGANKISEFVKNNQTLVLLHFNGYPVENDADYFTFANRQFLQSAESVNDNFGQSISFSDSGLSFNNNNRLTTNDQGTIEFFVSPKYDTYNDPVRRVYFDAAASVFEETTSTTKGSLSISGRAREILSVRLATDITQTGVDYFSGGNLEPDSQSITLGTALPFQQTQVVVTYIPTGIQGDRITIEKDEFGFIAFSVQASGTLYQVRQPVFWERNSWHRIKASFKFNSANNQDEIRLFVDGEERGSIRFGQGLLFGEGFLFGATVAGVTDQIFRSNMDFTDTITRFHIGQDFTGSFGAQARIDNFRLSNIALTSPVIAGQARDVNYNQIVDCMFPVIENAYTTMLLDFNRVVEEVEDFALLRDAEFGIFNFTINVIDSFRIVQSSARVQSMLEAMIHALKPANAKVDINYVR